MALRKMLGDIYSEECQALMQLIETQNHVTLNQWAIHYAKTYYLPMSEEDWLVEGLQRCEQYLEGQLSLKEIKPILKDLRIQSSKIKDPTKLACSRAIVTALSTINTPSNAFGFLLYGAAFKAYSTLGLEASKEAYDLLAAQELKFALSDLKKHCVTNEAHPVKIKWNC